MPSAAFARAAWVNHNNWMNFLFLSQNVATKGDSARYPLIRAAVTDDRIPDTCQTRRDAYTIRTAAPALLSAASLPYASMQSAAPVPAPPPGEVFLCPFFPVRPAVPPVSTIPFQRSRSNDPVPTIPFQRSRRTTWPIAGSAAGGD